MHRSRRSRATLCDMLLRYCVFGALSANADDADATENALQNSVTVFCVIITLLSGTRNVHRPESKERKK